ncbi:F0F1 ATP synthase subunit B' [Kiloniella laminariae]|uniref:ATP synthase subunit b n=1 Tax=Kiloniella laminariae TaxID=454162 RepID=A0ABT4LL26_9PROT|nr:F0F1 ATP synthase subunit B' [Kiloniella laminariae]MCZ4281803.1 F0F1 ATP synthase subunit B' [Kiloniella laminariae]
MPQFDPSTWVSQIFWLIITFGVLYFLLSKLALPRLASILEERENRVSGDLEKAERLKQEAEEVLADYQKAIADARTSALAALKESADKIAATGAKRQAEFDAQLKEKVQIAEDKISVARTEALSHIKDVATEVASAAAGKLLGADVTEAKVSKAVDEVLGGRG